MLMKGSVGKAVDEYATICKQLEELKAVMDGIQAGKHRDRERDYLKPYRTEGRGDSSRSTRCQDALGISRTTRKAGASSTSIPEALEASCSFKRV